MQRSKLTRREALGYGLRLLANGRRPPGHGRSARRYQAGRQRAAKPAEAKPAAPAATTGAAVQRRAAGPGPGSAESKPAEAAKPAAAAAPAAASGGSPAFAATGEMPKRGGTLRAVVQNDFVPCGR